MNKISVKECVFIDCISFTVVTVLLSTLWFIADRTAFLESRHLLELFCCTTLISILMYFTSKIPLESQLFATSLLLLDVAVVILGIGGGIFQWFPWEGKSVLQIIVILVTVFFVTHLIMVWQSRDTAKKINQKIKERENDASYH